MICPRCERDAPEGEWSVVIERVDGSATPARITVLRHRCGKLVWVTVKKEQTCIARAPG